MSVMNAPSYLGTTICGPTEFHWGQRTYVMGILNLTPDSFSGDGLGTSVEAALEQAQRMVAEGADIVDVGGESTRPGTTPIPIGEELRRVLPVIERLARVLPVPLSIDTYKAEVARRAIEAGASLINDVGGLAGAPAGAPEMPQVVAQAGVPVVITHNQQGTAYQHLIPEVIAGLRQRLEAVLSAGVRWEDVIVDPGFGFGKTWEQSLELLGRLSLLKALGRPILVGTSRKRMIGEVLNLPPAQRLEGTAATVALAVAQGTDLVRVHEVQAMARVVRMTDAVVRRPSSADAVAAGGAEVYLGLGANLGDRWVNLRQAVGYLAEHVWARQVSSVYETDPVGYTDQPSFLNAVVRGFTRLGPKELLRFAQAVERRMGREPTFRYGPRIIDVDLLCYDDETLDTPDLIIPHPRLTERAFVLIPLAQVAPGLRVRGKMVAEWAAGVAGKKGVRWWGNMG